MSTETPRPLIVGELNPFGGDESFALYPLPPECSGGRLQRFLGLSMTQYLRLFDRANLCRGRWSLPAARSRAGELLAQDRPAYVLCGSKVCAAFGLPFSFFSVDRSRGFVAAILPHPSGLNRIWNEAASPQRARDTVIAAGIALPHLPPT